MYNSKSVFKYYAFCLHYCQLILMTNDFYKAHFLYGYNIILYVEVIPTLGVLEFFYVPSGSFISHRARLIFLIRED